ncbi:unnamed protein product [Oncorhynchus mykiss]|uniref:Uncharacterized protein n=1 Tax=Oncorhynchus mykiss TaxID=8022 RepID=A0A060VU48_ONCMY|nr:unnamed protein product [Oncorhynchus mykiss]
MEEWAKIPATVCENLVKTYRKHLTTTHRALVKSSALHREWGAIWDTFILLQCSST